MLPPESSADAAPRARRRARRSRAMMPSAKPSAARQSIQPRRLNGGCAVGFEDRVLGEAHRGDAAGAVAVLGDAGDAAGERGARRPVGPDRRAEQLASRPDVGASVPAMSPASAAWPLPETPARPVIRPPRAPGRRRAGPGRRRSVETAGEVSSAGPAGDRRDRRRRDLGADHQARELVPVGVARSRRSPTRRPWRSTSTRSETAITSPSLWLMKTMASPSATARRQGAEERLGLLRRQHRGRLVEDQDAGVAVERLEDLDALALADGEVADPRVGVDLEAEAPGEVARCAPAPRRARCRGCQSGRVPSDDVLEHASGCRPA